ncbi:MAG: hypothetical protein R2788_18215 [Saprospiraceae bacterium]
MLSVALLPNGTITNISSPGETGETFYIELTPAAQTNCNNSPFLMNFLLSLFVLENPSILTTLPLTLMVMYRSMNPCPPFTGGGNDTNNAEALFGCSSKSRSSTTLYDSQFRPPFSFASLYWPVQP